MVKNKRKGIILDVDLEEVNELPKFMWDLYNSANRYSGATKPENVGQMTILARGFKDYKSFEKDYKNKYPDAIEKAKKKLFKKAREMHKIQKDYLTEEYAENFVKRLVLMQSYNGIIIQDTIMEEYRKKYPNIRCANLKEESMGIDMVDDNSDTLFSVDSEKAKSQVKATVSGLRRIFYKVYSDGEVRYYED